MNVSASQNLIVPDFIYVHADGNGTCVIGDTTKNSNTLKSEVAGVINYIWAKNHPLMSYKDYVQKVLFPGNKYDPGIKAKQEEKIDKFLDNLKELNHPMYEEASKLYSDLESKYLDPETQQVKFTIFPSVIELVNKLKNFCPFSVILRTFGNDGDVIAQEFSKSGVEMLRHATMFPNGIKFENESEVTSGSQQLLSLQKANINGQDQFKVWVENKKQSGFSKVIPCVEDACFEDKVVIALFIDDNFKKPSKSADGQVKIANPHEENIAYPKDIYGRATSWDSKGVIAIRVKTLQAALDSNYLVKKVNKQLEKRGFALLK